MEKAILPTVEITTLFERICSLFPAAQWPLTLESFLNTDSISNQEAATFLTCDQKCDHDGCKYVHHAIENIVSAVDGLVNGYYGDLPAISFACEVLGLDGILYCDFTPRFCDRDDLCALMCSSCVREARVEFEARVTQHQFGSADSMIMCQVFAPAFDTIPDNADLSFINFSGMTVRQAFMRAFDAYAGVEFDCLDVNPHSETAKELKGHSPYGGFDPRQSKEDFKAALHAAYRDVFTCRQDLGPKAAHNIPHPTEAPSSQN